MKRQVLLVEDDELCKEIVAELLAEIDVDITLATDGIQAISAVQKKHLDIVVMDMSITCPAVQYQSVSFALQKLLASRPLPG